MDHQYPPRIDRLVSQLCEEIDYWKEESEKYKQLYKDEVSQNIKQTNESFEHTKQMTGQLLSLFLNTQEDGNGGLVITKDGRQNILNSIKDK